MIKESMKHLFINMHRQIKYDTRYIILYTFLTVRSQKCCSQDKVKMYGSIPGVRNCNCKCKIYHLENISLGNSNVKSQHTCTKTSHFQKAINNTDIMSELKRTKINRNYPRNYYTKRYINNRITRKICTTS